MHLENARPLADLADRFIHRNTTKPPQEVVQALLTLLGDAEIVHTAVAYKVDQTSDDARATWHCMALADSFIADVTATRAGGEWYRGSADDPEDMPAPNVFGNMIPLSEIAECRLISLRSPDVNRWLTRWQLHRRLGDAIAIPWPGDFAGQEQHESLALEVAKRIR